MKLKVGILTMHRVHNCGSFLQAYALQQAMKSLGGDSEIIDYIYPNALHTSNAGSHPITFCNSTRHLLHNIYHFRWHVVKMQLHEMIWNLLLHLKIKLSSKSYYHPDELVANPPIYDLYVLGSDQVWNERFIKSDTTFFMSFLNDGKKCISYASSIPNLCLSDAFKRNANTYIKRYAAISTREKGSANVLSKLLKRDVENHVDPVFLLTAHEWRKKFHFSQSSGNYVLFYVLNYMGDISNTACNELNRFVVQQNKDNRKIYSNVAIPLASVELLNDFYPRGFMQIIANAEYVITDSFHTAAFSILFDVPVKPIIADTDSDIRIKDLSERLGRIDSEGFIHCDKEKLRMERERAFTYLKNSIG